MLYQKVHNFQGDKNVKKIFLTILVSSLSSVSYANLNFQEVTAARPGTSAQNLEIGARYWTVTGLCKITAKDGGDILVPDFQAAIQFCPSLRNYSRQVNAYRNLVVQRENKKVAREKNLGETVHDAVSGLFKSPPGEKELKATFDESYEPCLKSIDPDLDESSLKYKQERKNCSAQAGTRRNTYRYENDPNYRRIVDLGLDYGIDLRVVSNELTPCDLLPAACPFFKGQLPH